jgi:FtsZ-binding cell division protein ZapB
MQPSVPPPPAPPAPPALPGVRVDPSDPTVVATDAGGVGGVAVTRALPRTSREVAGLREQRRELSRQLESAQKRRSDVAGALERAHDPVNQNGLQGRLRVLDGRIAQLEADMAETGRLLTSAQPGIVVAQADRRDGGLGGERGPPRGAVAIVFILFVLFPLVLTIGRALRRRPTVTRPDPAARESAERLARLEQAVDAIAVEVERVSEGQRFVTRLLSESRGAAGPALARPADTLDVVPRQA